LNNYFLKPFFKELLLAKVHKKITYAKSRDEELEAETEILRDRDETFQTEAETQKNGSRDTS